MGMVENSEPVLNLRPDEPTGQAVDQGHADIVFLSEMLDDKFRLPGTNIRFGLDGILGLIPGVGDAVTTVVSGYLMTKAYRHGAPKRLLFKMARNVGIDWLVGTIPLVGDLFDFAFKANRMNVKLIEDHLKKHGGTMEEAPRTA